MATYAEIYDLWTSSALKKRAYVAVAKAAQDVLNEDPGTTNHANRVLWATASLENPEVNASKMMWPIVSNATVQAAGLACTDNDIQFVVNGAIDTFAGGT